MKKLIFLLISLLPALATWAEVGDEFTVDGLKYEVTSEVPKTVELIYNEDENPTGELVIPATVNGYSVTSIGEIAFLDCSGLTSIEIPNSVTRIGGSAFWDCSSLISIEIPGSVTSIGSGAFEGCTSLTSIEIPDGVRVISGLFYNCSGLTSIVIPNSVAFIGSYTFDGCTSLTDVYCYADPAQLEWYYDAEEFMADKATKFHVSDVSAWSSYSDANVTFVGDIELEFHVGDEFTLGNLKYKVTSEDPKTVELIGYCASYLTGELVIPTTVNGYSVTSIGESAFYYCNGLTGVTIGNNVTSIGAYSFIGCSGLTSLEIPSSVTAIGKNAFCQCFGLTSIEIPSSVTSIGEAAFEACTSLTSVKISNAVTSIGEWAFEGCTSLTSIEIPGSVTSIGWYTFSNCSGLTSIVVADDNPVYDSRDNCNAIIETQTNTLIAGCNNTLIPSSVTSIKGRAFYGRSGLTSITIPNSVTSIGGYALLNCSGLTSIVVADDNPVYDSRDNCNAIIKTQTNTLIVGCQNTVISGSVTSIDYGAFWGCSGLTSIDIPSSVTSIGAYSFIDCSGLTSITIPNSVTSIGIWAFNRCSCLTDVYCYADPAQLAWDNDVKEFMADKATKFHVADASVWEEKFPNANVTFVGDLDAFFVVDNLRYRITSNSGNMVRGFETNRAANASLNTVELVGYVTMPTDAVEIPAVVSYNGEEYTVTSIGANAFTYCSSMTSVTIPSSVTNIEDGAFEGCTGLTDVYCNADPAQLTWSSDAKSFMSDKATNFHVTDVAAWEASFADANVTFVDDQNNSSVKGDVNGDGSVSVTDVTMTISHILGQTPDGFNAAVADVNGDGSVTITDVTMMINIILKGDIPEETKYYWYVGHENPANMTSITALSSNAASAGAGWRTIGTTLPTYSKTNPLWTASDQIVTASSKSTMYVALPSETIKSRNDITGEDVTSDGWTINLTKKTLNGVQYTIWTSISGKKSFSETLY